jgi:outer membrane biosynthesis protein TonB
MKMSKASETYAILCVEGDVCKIVRGGYSGAKEVKDATTKMAKQEGNVGKVFVPIRMWAPISFKEIKRYEFVEPEIDFPILKGENKEESENKVEKPQAEKKEEGAEAKEPEQKAEEPEPEDQEGEKAEEPEKEEEKAEEPEVEKAQEQEAETEAQEQEAETEAQEQEAEKTEGSEASSENKPAEEGKVEESADDSTAFDELFSSGTPQKKAGGEELF